MKEKIIVGVNDFVVPDEKPIEVLKISREAEEQQRKRLERVKKTRKAARVKSTLADLKKACATKENLMPFVLEAVREYVTLGEIVEVFKTSFGTYRDPGHY